MNLSITDGGDEDEDDGDDDDDEEEEDVGLNFLRCRADILGRSRRWTELAIERALGRKGYQSSSPSS